jgi:hypothetical protein
MRDQKIICVEVKEINLNCYVFVKSPACLSAVCPSLIIVFR